MENKYNDSEIDKKVHNNSLLFGIIHKNKTPEEKIKKITKYLDRGADINAADANYKNNTPLHVAVMKEESEVVSFLLERGALVSNKNSDNKTALDIARRSDKSTCRRKYIVTILEAFDNNKLKPSCGQQDLETNFTRKTHPKSLKITKDVKCLQPVACAIENQTQSQAVNSGSSEINRIMDQNKPKQIESSKIFHYQKRTGTSGLSGQLYETKLTTLILLRALYVHEVKPFLIATNVVSLGTFDDIVFRFYLNKDDKPKIMFVQTKHRDNPAKRKFTIEELIKINGDFSLHNYLESYIKIRQMFDPEKSDDMFRGQFKNMDCEFIIYTPAFENFTKMKAVGQTECRRFINTSSGKVFQFDYNYQDVELLVQTVCKSRAVLLAKRFSKLIFKDNSYSNMMRDDLIKTYHVFLAGHIQEVKNKDGESSKNNFRYAKFQDTFFSSTDDLLLAFKATICKEVLQLKGNRFPKQLDEVESFLRSFTFKVPLDFGNLNFCFTGSVRQKENKLKYFCSKFEQLFGNADKNANGSGNIVMKFDDNMVGPNEIFKNTDFDSQGLGGLVGNLLVSDNETKTLKFNCDIDTLSEDNLKLFDKLKSDVNIGTDLSKCRFDINVHHFPRLSLLHDEHDKILVKDFLAKLFFYTNQATEDEVEKILKKEIDTYFVSSITRQSDPLFRVKCDAIFLEVHDRVQKWWQQQIKAPYLTESCEYFFEAQNEVLNSLLLRILNFTYTTTIKNAMPELKFKDSALELLHLDAFFPGTEKILGIITEENVLSSIKLIQYFKERNLDDYAFIDLDYVAVGNYFGDVKSAIKQSKVNTLIFVCKSRDVLAEIVLLIKYFEGKIIIIYNQDLANEIRGLALEDVVEKVDSQTGFKDLADTMRTMLLEERYILFQGNEVPLGILFTDESYHIINPKVMNMIINNEEIKIGNFLNNPAYDKILHFYIHEKVCRYITLDPSIQASGEFNVLKYNELDDNFTPDARDIVLITDKYEEFAEFINTYVNCNVHWFKYNGDACLVWYKTRGNLLNMFKHIHRGVHDELLLQPVTLKDVNEKVVIISGEPGMGKSSLLSHLAIATKQKHPTLWISKINLLEYADEFKSMKKFKDSIDFEVAVKFLFRVMKFEAELDIIIDQVSVIGDEISFNKNIVESNLTGLNLFEIELFIYCYNNNRVVLLFDGFDEICPDYANEFMQIINILKNSKVSHLWVTSRLYNVLHQLENTLETFSFTISPLGLDDQVKFLKKIWSKNVGLIKLDGLDDDRKMHFCVKLLLQKLSDALQDQHYKFLSIPLHLYMISEICQDSFHKVQEPDFAQERVNLNQLYESFVERKFYKIRFGEKKPLMCVTDPDMRKLIDNELTGFLNIHKLTAAHVIFCQSKEIPELFDDHDITAIHNFIERIKVGEEKTGIIEQIINNKPKFVHYTFAEYFAAEFLYDRLKSPHWKSSSWTYFVNTFLIYEKGVGTRRFFNAKLGYHSLILNEMLNADVNEIFETLLLEHNKLANLLFISLRGNCENIAIFLLKCVKAVLSKNKLNDFTNVILKCPQLYYDDIKVCLLCCAIRENKLSFFTFVIELIKELDLNGLVDLLYCFLDPRYHTVPHGCSICVFIKVHDINWLKSLLPHLPPPLIVELFCMQLSHLNRKKEFFAGDQSFFNPSNESLSHSSKEYIESNILKKSEPFIHIYARKLGTSGYECLHKAFEQLNNEQLMTIFCTKDYKKRLPAHAAAFYHAFEFFDKLESLLERSQFLKICTSLDGSGRTPIDYFRYTKRNRDKLDILLNKVNVDKTDAKLTLNYFIDKAKPLSESENELTDDSEDFSSYQADHSDDFSERYDS